MTHWHLVIGSGKNGRNGVVTDAWCETEDIALAALKNLEEYQSEEHDRGFLPIPQSEGRTTADIVNDSGTVVYLVSLAPCDDPICDGRMDDDPISPRLTTDNPDFLAHLWS